ncbi:UDP-2,3-diacylglucosamine hydrolase [Luminiphilus syltensis NOR5-1B]|uniref:UDP-2,3-diacylglucosamine hydrolase n=1 Tax=Luminiphilus syltensis NOR5-1B TaxID=565045 RepID=B8KYF0_9GAMM|nr:UDP-2,3-diacylglucosamine diphosphatase [Luminiphilus syltensis]EED36884.1 UDP-2,3-diacylglucosamine hydrolase [Luminiphilus syltensis NOR5-1B]
MSECLFISDLHLSEEHPAVEQALTDFLHREQKANALYVLGDLFEVWIGDDDDTPLAERVADRFKAYSDNGPALFFMVGNRDFLMGPYYAGRCGATLLEDPTVHNIGGEPTLLMHGDSLCTEDIDYQAFRAQSRQPQWQQPVLAKPLEERRQLAQSLRAMSRDAGSNKAEDIMDVTHSAVNAAMETAGVTRLIHGHTHRPAHHRVDRGDRWVLGDWLELGWCLRARDSGLSLEKFDIGS